MYRIREEYQGLIITKNVFAIGTITLDTNTIQEKHLENYLKFGFNDVIEVIEDEVIEDEVIEETMGEYIQVTLIDEEPIEEPIVISKNKQIKYRGKK